MGELLRRRRELVVPSGIAPSGPLYSFSNMNLSGSGSMSSCKITDGNRFYYSAKRNSYPVYFQFDNGKTGGNKYETTDTPMFDFHEGDHVVLKAKNIRYKSADAANTCGFALIRDNDTVWGSISIKPEPASSSVFVDFADVEKEYTVGGERTILSFRCTRSAGTYNTTFEIYFNLEMYVNDIRYF